MIGQQATGGFQAPEPYVPESAKAAGALYEAGISPSDINALQQATMTPEQAMQMSITKDVKPPAVQNAINQAIQTGQSVSYNRPKITATTGFGAPTPAPAPVAATAKPAPFDPVAYRNQFKPNSGGLASVAQPTPIEPVNLTGAVPTIPQPQTQQMPSFYQQTMPMMAQPFNPMGYGPMGRFMNPYGGGLGGMAYNFMNRPMPLYGQGGQFTAGQYQAPEPIAPTQPSFGFSPYGGFGYF